MNPNTNIMTIHPDEFSAGRPDKFTGTITGSWLEPWHYPKSTTGKYMLFAVWEITPDEDSGFEPFENRLRAGFLNSTVPSNTGLDKPDDEREPAGGSWEDYLALSKGDAEIPAGEEEQYRGEYFLGQAAPKKTEFAQACRALGACGYSEWSQSMKQFIGLRCRFDLVPAENQTEPAEGQPKREWTVLVPTELLGRVAKSSGVKPKGSGVTPKVSTTTTAAAATTTPPASTATKQASTTTKPSSDDGFREEVAGAVVAILAEEGTVTKGNLLIKVRNSFPGDKGKSALQVAAVPGFLDSIDGVAVSGNEVSLG